MMASSEVRTVVPTGKFHSMSLGSECSEPDSGFSGTGSLSLFRPDDLAVSSDLDPYGLTMMDSNLTFSDSPCVNPLVSQTDAFKQEVNIALGINQKGNILKTGIDLYGPAEDTPKVQFKTLKGVGTLEYANGDVYKGCFVDNDFVGFGEMTYANGDHYVGEWKQSQMCGQGTYTFQKGDVYKGQFIQNKFNGHGVLKYSNGTKYEGEFKEDVADGAGRLTFMQEGEVIDLNGHFYKGHYFGKYTDAMLHHASLSQPHEECRESFMDSPVPEERSRGSQRVEVTPQQSHWPFEDERVLGPVYEAALRALEADDIHRATH